MADASDEWWTTSDVASFLGLQIGTVSSYRQRGQMPAPDKTLGRTHLWHPETITRWHRTRPRVGEPPSEHSSGPSHQNGGSSADTEWQVHGERSLYDNEWVRLSLVDVELPDGQRFEHHIVTLKPAAMAAVLDDTGQRVLMMWRHRFASNVWNWELPGGIVEPGEDPAKTAAREVEEETGYRPRHLEHVVTFEPNIGMVRNAHHVYVAHGAERIGEPTETTEMQRMEWVPLADVPQLIKDGQILNSGTLVALLQILATRAQR
jgi:8-oxo-dGTP pyrophosphatase MutT (NUDIX family)